MLGVGERLRSARIEAEMSQTEAAQAVGVSTASISNLESGRIILKFEMAVVLSDLYGVSLDWLAGNDRNLKIDHNLYRRHRKYSVYNRGTDEPVMIHGTAQECADAMGMTLGSFYSIKCRTKNNELSKWEILEDEKDGE